MFHKKRKNKTLNTIKRRQNRSSHPVIIGYWILTKKITKQLILENSTQINNTGNLVFTPKPHRHKSRNVASHLHEWSQCQPRRHWQSTANTASPMMNECERVLRHVRVLDQTCRRERSTEPLTTTMHGLNQEVEERRTTLTHKKMPWVSMVVSSPKLCRHLKEIGDQNAHAHEMPMNTHQASTQHNTAMTSNQICFTF